MGGSAFPNTCRLDVDEYKRMSKILNQTLTELGCNFLFPAEVKDKSSFGDIDLYAVLPNGLLVSELENAVNTAVGSTTKAIINQTEISFLSKERYQIDINVTNREMLEISVAVHSNGDFVWILQRSLSRIGLLLTTNGLFLSIPPTSGLSKKECQFLVSRNPKEIAEFFGIPEYAFDGKTSLTKLQLFEIASSCWFFSISAVNSWANRKDSNARRRSKERTLVVEFVEWCKEKNFDNKEDMSPEEGQQLAAKFFNLESEFNDFILLHRKKLLEIELRVKCREILNGARLKDWFPELAGPVAGLVMKRVREQYSTVEDYHSWLTNNTFDQIKSQIMELCADIFVV